MLNYDNMIESDRLLCLRLIRSCPAHPCQELALSVKATQHDGGQYIAEKTIELTFFDACIS